MISVLLPTFNSEIFISECLDRLLTQEFRQPHEILALDDCSSDGTVEVIRNKLNPKIKLIANPKRLGLTSNINNGIGSAKGDIIAFINPDCYVNQNWLSEIQKSLANCDFVGGPVYLFDKENIKYPPWWNKSLEYLIGICSDFYSEFIPLGGNSAFKKNVLLNIQHYMSPAKLNCIYGDDRLRGKIALKNGYRMCFNKNMIAYHHISQDRLKFSSLAKRSTEEGYCWALRERSLRILFERIAAILLNICKFSFTLNFNYFFRILVSLSYFFNFLKTNAHCH